MQIEVIHVRPNEVWRRTVELEVGSTVRQAIEASGLIQDFPEMQAEPPVVGVFGRSRSPQHILQPGDRVEVYRPLVYDPMESRRRRARHRHRRNSDIVANMTTEPNAPR